MKKHTRFADALVAGIGDVMTSEGMSPTRIQMTTEIDALASASEPPNVTVADIATIDAVTHSVEKTRTVCARTVQLAVVSMETWLTATDVVRVGEVPAVSVVLTGGRRARIVMGAVATVETVVAKAVIVRVGAEVSTVAAVLAWTGGAPVNQLTQVAVEPCGTVAPQLVQI